LALAIESAPASWNSGGAAPKERAFGATGTLSADLADEPLLPTVKEGI